MNKQQLAAKIWESANKLRSKIEANEYKDYILGFIFYKYLSDRELKFAKEEGFSQADIETLSENDAETMNYIRDNIGYFIAYNDLFSTWLAMGRDFDVSNVRDALSAFSRLINENHKNVFSGIFKTLETGLSKLGENSASQTRAISSLLQLIKDIPMDGRQDYDVLGFIYEYLISMFAANAGKKAGEFYTPHEVSILMSEIVANHLRNRTEIEIYDPTSGSGSLLINIGHSIARYIREENRIKYYAQELKENTYNLTRMNLVMRGILPDNIVTRNGDTLEDDWPFFEDNDPAGTYKPLFVDAVVSNPPYSQHWDPENKEHDVRFSNFGVAPKSKADYAFLLHDLYHLRPDGIMTIVLPHGVLFRGDAEGEIRKQLLECNHIDAIIGLPANIFFGTGIPTIIMVLKKNRPNTDVMIIDASKGFAKVGKSNQLRASDIRRIADTVIGRITVAGYSRSVELSEIRNNDYNLNIPRYIDSSEGAEHWDIHALMFGSIPEEEIDELAFYWNALPGLREALFTGDGNSAQLADGDIETIFNHHSAVQNFRKTFENAFSGLVDFLKAELLGRTAELIIPREESRLSDDIFKRLSGVPLIDKYEAYQLLDDEWVKIAVDLEIIQTESMEAATKVDPNMILKKKDGKDEEVQDGWTGHIMPFSLVQEKILPDDLRNIQKLEQHQQEIEQNIKDIIDALPEEEKDTLLNDDNDAFNATALNSRAQEVLADLETEESKILDAYLEIGNTADKLSFAAAHPNVNWSAMQANKNGTYAKAVVKKRIVAIKSQYNFESGTLEDLIIRANKYLKENKELKNKIKTDSETLHLKTKSVVEQLTPEQVQMLLEAKWIHPLAEKLNTLPMQILSGLIQKIKDLSEKYTETMPEMERQITETESELSGLLDQLTGSVEDIAGLAEFRKLLEDK